MAHLQYIPGDPRLVDQLVYELKSKGIFDQFRKDCIADVDTRPAYQNLRQRVENSVSTFLARQCWQPDLNKNQLREKLRKHILDGNYLEQGVERIVDQVVNPKVASVFIPQVEDLVYNYLGITRKKTAPVPATSNGKVNDNDLLPTDLEAVSPGSVKSHDDKNEAMDVSEDGKDNKMEIDQDDKPKEELKVDSSTGIEVDKVKADVQDTELSGLSELTSNDSQSSIDKSNIPLPEEEIKLENIPEPDNSPPKINDMKVELEKIQLPEPTLSMDIPLPEEIMKSEKDTYFKPINSDDDDSSSDSSLRRNMSPLTPIRNFNNENSCDAQQAFENDSADSKCDKKEITETSFRFTIETKTEATCSLKSEKKDTDPSNLSYQFSSQVTINTFATPMYDDSSNSNLLQIDYESDANSKINQENKIPESTDQNSDESKKDKKQEEKKSSHKSSHRDRDSHRHSSSKDRRSDSKQSSSRDGKSDRKSSKESSSKSTSKSSHKERSSDRSDRKDSRDSSRHRSSHKSSSHKDSKSHRTSSSSQRYSSSSKQSDERKSSSSSKDKDKSSRDDKYSKEKLSKDSKSSSNSHRSDKDKKSSSSSSKSKHDDKEKKKEKKATDDHYSASGRGSHSRRSTDRDSNDGSSSSKGSHNPPSAKSSESKKENKSSTSKSDNTTTSGDSTSPSDKEHMVNELKKSQSANVPQTKPVIRVENHLEVPIASPPRLPFVPDITMKKPRIAANLEEAKKLMKMRKFLDDEQKRMNQEAALLLEFQANVRPSLSQVYSSIPGPELEFACITAAPTDVTVGEGEVQSEPGHVIHVDNIESRSESISDILNAAQQVENIEVTNNIETEINKEKDNNEIDAEVDENPDKATVHIEADGSLIQVDNNVLDDSKDINIEVINSLDSETTDNVEPTDISVDTEKCIEAIATIDEKTQIKENAMDIDRHVLIEKEYDDIKRSLKKLLADNEKIFNIEVTIVEEECPEMDKSSNHIVVEETDKCSEEDLEYFAEHEKYSAELERDKFSKFLKSFTEKYIDKMYLINCDTYEENIIKEVSQNFGNFKIVNYHKNGHLKLNSAAKTIVRNLNVSSEITLPLENGKKGRIDSPLVTFSPVKSECSFELSSDYDAKLEEMVSKTSRKEIMEIILGSVEESNTEAEMPTIDYCNDSNIESDSENAMKRKFCEVESSENNNRKVLTPNKIRRLSESDQITSTTEESEVRSNNNMTLNTTVRSKYLGRARRVGLPRPRRSNLSNSPSSDKSIENYEQNTPVTPNGKIKTQRNKVQRYDTSDLYKPKLHYLSRRNNIS